jgi:hypothetical protein
VKKRMSVGSRVARDMAAKQGLDALFSDPPVHQSTGTTAKPKKFEKGTFYFDPDDLALLEKVWLGLMGEGVRCNKSEIVSVLIRAGLEEHERNPKSSTLARASRTHDAICTSTPVYWCKSEGPPACDQPGSSRCATGQSMQSPCRQKCLSR